MNLLTKIALGVFTLCVLALGVTTFVLYKQNKKLSIKPVEKTVEQSISAAVVKQFIDSSGKKHTTFSPVAPFTKKEIADGVVNKPLIDSIARALDIKTSQADSYYKISQVSEAKALKAQKEVDSLKNVIYSYKNKYIALTYRPGNLKDTANQNGLFDYKYNADVTVVQYTKRKKVLGLPIGANQSFIDISSSDPNATINGLSSFTVAQAAPSFGLRVQALTNYNFDTKRVSPGIGAEFDFKRWSARGAYYYRPGTNTFRPVVGLRYDIIRL